MTTLARARRTVRLNRLAGTMDAANQEFDPAKRAQLVARIMRHYHDQAPSIFLHEVRQYDGVGPKLRHYNPLNMIINYHELDLAN